jgi:predicted unusual protein kinase regulating ubiquinone biosynthesis (AarF/ABC1/UbiB family)
MATNLDPEFDPWTETIPFAERLAKEELQQNWRGWLQEVINMGQLVFKLPGELDRVLTQAQRGNLVIQTSLAPDARKSIQRLEQALQRLAWMVVAAALLIAGVNWQTGPSGANLGYGFMLLAVLAFLWGMFKRG